MKILLLLTISILSLVLPGCSNSKKSQGNNPVPSCIQQKIDSFEKTQGSPLRVDEYTYNGKTVYLITADCCDQYNTVYDDNCVAICSPSGGLTGKGDGKCADFAATAKLVRMVWEKGKGVNNK